MSARDEKARHDGFIHREIHVVEHLEFARDAVGTQGTVRTNCRLFNDDDAAVGICSNRVENKPETIVPARISLHYGFLKQDTEGFANDPAVAAFHYLDFIAVEIAFDVIDQGEAVEVSCAQPGALGTATDDVTFCNNFEDCPSRFGSSADLRTKVHVELVILLGEGDGTRQDGCGKKLRV